MRRWLVIVVLLAGCGGSSAPPRPTATPTQPPVEGSLPGARATRACAAAGDFWPTQTLALGEKTAWVACKENNAVQSLAGTTVDLDGQAIAVLEAFDAIWALSDRGTLSRIVNGKIAKTIDLQASKPYNLWSGAGSLWSIDDASGEVIRIDPNRNQVMLKVRVGDGPADMIFAGRSAYIPNHRDRTVVALDTKTNRPRKLGTIAPSNAAPERIEVDEGALWITGRGMDLFKVDPATGKTLDKIEIGGSGIDVILADHALWVPSRSEEVDQSGLPTMEALHKVDPRSGEVTTVAEASDRVDVHGVTADYTHLWLSDNTAGIVYRVPLQR